MAGWILHVDLDQFLAAVEVLRRPELAGRPVVVGGDGDPRRRRQVVATASYEARAAGVRSGMPLAEAARRCPDAVFLPSDKPAYEAMSERVMAVLRTFPVVVEVWGWDEAFVGAETDDPDTLAHSMQDAILDGTGLHAAVGIGETKLLAKTATGMAKPGRVARLTRAEWIPAMGWRPVSAVWGIGPRVAARLAELGITTVEDLARSDHGQLARAFGPRVGPGLRVLGLGGDDDPVHGEPWVPRSRGAERTYERDVRGRTAVEREVARLADQVTAEVVAGGRTITHVAVKVRWASFFTRSRVMTLGGSTSDPAVVRAAAATLLERFVNGGFDLDRPVRLLGVRLMLAPLDPAASRRVETPEGMDSVAADDDR